jgi:hypothetical protein
VHQKEWLADFKEGSLPGRSSSSIEVQAWMHRYYQGRTDTTVQPEKLTAAIKNAKWDGAEFWSAIDKGLVNHYLNDYGFQLEGELLDNEIKKNLRTLPIRLHRALFSNWRILGANGLSRKG